MWSDNDTIQDLLGFEVHASLLRSVVMDHTMLPCTIGVFGDWGGGKTSVMRMLERSLDPEQQEDPILKGELQGVVCLYVNGWLFEGYDDAKSALITTILEQLTEHKRFGVKIREGARDLLKSVNWMRAARWTFREFALPALAAPFTGGLSLIPAALSPVTNLVKDQVQKLGTDAQKAEQVPAPGPAAEDDIETNVRTFRDRFAKLLADSDIDTLVVLIDDLDRCSPKRILENLEAIKLFLNVDGTAFVIGADPRIVRYAVTREYGEAQRQVEEEGTRTGTSLTTDYLEKVIQIPYHLPKLSPGEVTTYMSLLFCQREAAEHLDAILQGYREHKRTDRYTPFGYANIEALLQTHGAFVEPLKSRLQFSLSAAPIITDGLKGNPRQVKRFLNAFMLRRRLAEVAQLDLSDEVLVKLMVLEYVSPERFQDLSVWQTKDQGRPETLKAMEDAANQEPPDETAFPTSWNTISIRRWLRLDPPLGDEDLRDYFWVARDRLESMLDDATLIPPLVRQVLRDLLDETVMVREAAGTRAIALPTELQVKLLTELVRQLRARPGQDDLYTALTSLAAVGLPDAIGSVEDVVRELDAKDLPPLFGNMLLNLYDTKPELQPRLALVINQLKRGETAVAVALEDFDGNV